MTGKKLSEMTDKELKDEYLAMWQQVHQIGCVGVKDMMWEDALRGELIKRGFEISEGEPVIYKEDEDDGE